MLCKLELSVVVVVVVGWGGGGGVRGGAMWRGWGVGGGLGVGRESQVLGEKGTWMGTRGAVHVSDTIILFIGLRHGC